MDVMFVAQPAGQLSQQVLSLGGVAVVNFSTSFNYGDLYDIVVVPEYTPGNDADYIPTPLVINVTGDFDFNGIMNISGNDGNPYDRMLSPKARCGGHRGPRKEPFPATPALRLLLATIFIEVNTRVASETSEAITTILQLPQSPVLTPMGMRYLVSVVADRAL